MSTIKVKVGVLVVSLAVVGAGLYLSVMKLGNSSGRPLANSQYAPHGGSADAPANIEDDRYLIGESHYIFVGKVVKRTGTLIMVGPQISAQYAVDVISNIKGNLAGVVTVAQMGASFNYRTNRVYFLFGDDG